MVKRKAPKKKEAMAEKEKSAQKASQARYFYGLGRRKSAVAKAKLIETKEKFKILESVKVNGRMFLDYFPLSELRDIVIAPFKAVGFEGNFELVAWAKGGGLRGQAEALRLGIARALVRCNEEWKKNLRDSGYLTRDARKVERKKAGLKKARRAPQWQKR